MGVISTDKFIIARCLVPVAVCFIGRFAGQGQAAPGRQPLRGAEVVHGAAGMPIVEKASRLYVTFKVIDP